MSNESLHSIDLEMKKRELYSNYGYNAIFRHCKIQSWWNRKQSINCDHINRGRLIDIAKRYNLNFSVGDFIKQLKKDPSKLVVQNDSDDEMYKEYITQIIIVLRREWEISKLES